MTKTKNLQIKKKKKSTKSKTRSSSEESSEDETTHNRPRSAGDDHCSIDKDQLVVFASHSKRPVRGYQPAIRSRDWLCNNIAPGYLCIYGPCFRERLSQATTVLVNVLKSMKKYLLIIDREIRLRSGDPPVEQLISSSDQQLTSGRCGALGNFVYETLGNIYKSRGTRVSAVCLGHQARSTLDAAEKLLTPGQAIDKADLMEKLHGVLDSDRTKKTSKALLQAGKQSTTSTSAITPIMGPPRCLV